MFRVVQMELNKYRPAYACQLSHFSYVQLFATLWTLAHQAPLSLEFSRQGYWSGLPWSPRGDLPTQGMNPHLLDCRWILYNWATWEAHKPTYKMLKSGMGSSEKLKLAKITDYTAFTLSRILTFLDLKFLLSKIERTGPEQYFSARGGKSTSTLRVLNHLTIPTLYQGLRFHISIKGRV